MRRLLVSLAFVAALAAAPQAAFAVLDQPVITTPVSPVTYTQGPVTLGWGDTTDAITYSVYRADDPGCTTYSSINLLPILPPGPFTYTDTTVADGSTYCYQVHAEDALTNVTISSPVTITYDITPPVVTAVASTGGDGCTPFTLTGAVTATDVSPLTFTADSVLLAPDTSYTPPGNPYDSVSPVVVAADAAGNTSILTPFPVPGHVLDPTRPPAPGLEVSTDPDQRKVTLSWDVTAPDDGAPVLSHRLRVKGPQPLTTIISPVPDDSVAIQNLQVDATYEFSLDANDVCDFGPRTVRLVRLNDTTPPSMPIMASPGFNPVARVVNLAWVAASDNIQVDHYEILRNGVPVGATDATSFTDPTPTQHALLSYVVRAVDTNGNSTESAPAPIQTPDWTPPTAPLPVVTPEGSGAVLRWPAAGDNVGVVGYIVKRDGRQIASMTAAVKLYRDLDVPAGTHVWTVIALDGAGLQTPSGPVPLKIVKRVSRASLVAMRLAGTRRGAARYSLAGPGRLLLDLRVVGTLPKPKLRLYVKSGRGRITVWRGTPGSSAPRLRLGSALARHGYVTIRLGRTLHAGRIRLVLIASGRVVIVGTDGLKPSMRAG